MIKETTNSLLKIREKEFINCVFMIGTHVMKELIRELNFREQIVSHVCIDISARNLFVELWFKFFRLPAGSFKAKAFNT